jgi:hypothetical protein
MTADVCPGPPGSTSPIGITPRNKVYNTDASSQAKNIFTMPADLVKVVKEDLYLARLTFARQYEIVYGCDISELLRGLGESRVRNWAVCAS